MRRRAFAGTDRPEPGEIIVTDRTPKWFLVAFNDLSTVDQAFDRLVSKRQVWPENGSLLWLSYTFGGRVIRGCSLLLNKRLSVKETAAALGFCDEFHFSRVFKKITGRPPSALFGRELGGPTK